MYFRKKTRLRIVLRLPCLGVRSVSSRETANLYGTALGGPLGGQREKSTE